MATKVLEGHGGGFMFVRSFLTFAAFLALGSSLTAQPRRASIRGGGGDRGKCTIEVVVDGVADVEIRGDSAILRTVSGRPAEWRRFECTSAVPPNPTEFRFSGVDGRGRQELIRDPRSGGVAVVRIEDKDAGAEGYTFDITWSGGAGYPGYPNQDRNMGVYPPQNRPRSDDRDYNRGGDPNRDMDRGRDRDRDRNGRVSYDQAVSMCQDAVRQQAAQRFGTADIAFRRTALNDGPGRQDAVTGIFDVRTRNGRDEAYRFSCSVNFENGQVRSANIESMNGGGAYAPGNLGATPTRQAIDACQRAVEQRVRRDGYRSVEFGPMNVDDRSGRNDQIVGSATAQGDPFDFTCNMNAGSGVVRSVDIRGR